MSGHVLAKAGRRQVVEEGGEAGDWSRGYLSEVTDVAAGAVAAGPVLPVPADKRQGKPHADHSTGEGPYREGGYSHTAAVEAAG